jgi:hypothetical protein
MLAKRRRSAAAARRRRQVRVALLAERVARLRLARAGHECHKGQRQCCGIWRIGPIDQAYPVARALAARKHFEEPSPESELAPWELVPSERVLAWVPQPGWGSSPECRWVPSRVDEHESRATFLIEQAGLPD